MTITSPILIVAATAVLVFAAAPTYASSSVHIYVYSQKASDESAHAGGSISYHESTGGSHGSEVSHSSVPSSLEEGSPAGESPSVPAASPTPVALAPCIVRGEPLVGPCYGVVPYPAPAPAARGKAQPPINPAVLSASVADHLALSAGRIEASPSAEVQGLTGVASWFWLSPPPVTESLTVALRGERVTVTASASAIGWSFGDTTSMMGGPGVPYRDGSVPTAAVRHMYQTRCLPGDAGHDPNVLPSCGPAGYTVSATVAWTITYTASGPVRGGGSLPPRTTTTSLTYPVSEARSFLTSGGSA